MLEMKSHCERCECALPAQCDDAYICSFECTFCATCAAQVFRFVCPNCNGELVRRPRRVRKEINHGYA
ncbi:DUF1272 domain-containing protein [Chitinibacter sp. S2-10]|uniref:DUF1272 domain-containing protein n=1 Tax=Chitinibacter sp. S2-10 TaxID=3373597 RepID=UPI00397735CE